MARHQLRLTDDQAENLRALRASIRAWEARYGRARRHTAMCEQQLYGHYDAEASMLKDLSTPLLEEIGVSADQVEEVQIGDGGQVIIVTEDAPDP